MVYFNSCNISMIMTHVNVHSGYSDKKGPTSRESEGCVTFIQMMQRIFSSILNGIKTILSLELQQEK